LVDEEVIAADLVGKFMPAERAAQQARGGVQGDLGGAAAWALREPVLGIGIGLDNLWPIRSSRGSGVSRLRRWGYYGLRRWGHRGRCGARFSWRGGGHAVGGPSRLRCRVLCGGHLQSEHFGLGGIVVGLGDEALIEHRLELTELGHWILRGRRLWFRRGGRGLRRRLALRCLGGVRGPLGRLCRRLRGVRWALGWLSGCLGRVRRPLRRRLSVTLVWIVPVTLGRLAIPLRWLAIALGWLTIA